MKVITRTWQRGLVGKLIVGLAGLTACCCASSFVAVLSPSRPQPSAQPTAPALALAAVTFAAPTAAPTATPAPTEAPAAIPTDVPTAAPVDPPTPEPTAAPTTPAAPIVTAAGQVNVRAGPGTDYATIGQLAAGQAAPITGKSADGTWWQIELAGAPGWVRGDLVAAAGPLEAVASVEAPALPATAAAPPTTEPAAAAPAGPTRDPRNPGYVWNWGAGTQDGAACICGGPDLNCRDFSSWEQAQACFDKCGGNNVFGLDNNSNNVVCERPAD